MNAHPRHSGLRPKRCLPAKFHFENRPLPTHLKIRTTRFRVPIRLKFPKSRQTIVTASNSANSRLFTNCYPISAAFAPRVNQIGPLVGGGFGAATHDEIHNES